MAKLNFQHHYFSHMILLRCNHLLKTVVLLNIFVETVIFSKDQHLYEREIFVTL